MMKVTHANLGAMVWILITVLIAAATYTGVAWSSNEDPRLQAARRLTASIQRTEQEIARQEEAAFRIIEAAINKLPDGTLQAQLETLAGFRQATSILDAMARDLLAHRDTIITDLESLHEMTQTAVSVYAEAARMYQEYADEEPFDEIKQDYVTLADAWTAMAAFMDKRTKRLAVENEEIRDTMQYLERTSVFLGRLGQNLESIPDLQALQEREQYLLQLRRYVRSFEEFRNLFRKFNAALQSEAHPVEPQPTSSPAGATQPARDVPGRTQGNGPPTSSGTVPATNASLSRPSPGTPEADLLPGLLPGLIFPFALLLVAVLKSHPNLGSNLSC